MLLTAALITVHIAASALLAAFGYHRFAMARRFRKLPRSQPPPVEPRADRALPPVTVQLPLFNERYVAERAIRAAAGLDYPRARLDIQVLDDSTDETTPRVAAVVQELQAAGVRIRHIRRTDRTGFKAGALAHGLGTAAGELIAIFDADFVPRPDFLRRIVPEFDDEAVGMVQARWDHLNRDTSVLTRAQALQLDAHFTTEHGVRAAAGLFFNFNGTAGVWRRRTIDEAGGWQPDTLTEDLDLSYRAQLEGWRFVYRDDVAVPAELPVEVAAYRIQQQRWAQGGVQTAVKLLPRILTAKLPGAVKRSALWHLLIHFSYPLLLMVTVAGLAVGLLSTSLAFRWVLAIDGLLLTFATGSLMFFYGVTARARDPGGWKRQLGLVPVIMVLGAGIAWGQSAAIWHGLTRARTPFRRTPKYRIGAAPDRTWRFAAYRISSGGRALAECLAGMAVIGVGVVEAAINDIVPSGLVLLLGIGLITVGMMALLQHGRPPVSYQARPDLVRD